MLSDTQPPGLAKPKVKEHVNALNDAGEPLTEVEVPGDTDTDTVKLCVGDIVEYTEFTGEERLPYHYFVVTRYDQNKDRVDTLQITVQAGKVTQVQEESLSREFIVRLLTRRVPGWGTVIHYPTDDGFL